MPADRTNIDDVTGECPLQLEPGAPDTVGARIRTDMEK